METPPTAALALLVPALPISLYVAWTDLARMKIRNHAVLALVLSFALVGPFVLPLDDFAWRWSHLVAMLLIGVALNAAGAMGAGDAKFIAAAAPFVAFGDAGALLAIFAAATIGGYLVHRAARASPLRRLAPGWQSWDAGKRFPLGFPLGVTLLTYLGLAAIS